MRLTIRSSLCSVSTISCSRALKMVRTGAPSDAMEGAVYAHICRQYDRRRRELQVGDPGYRGMVLRALSFSTVISLQFELGPLSEASIGNVGMRDSKKLAWG